jgi:integrase
VKKHIWSIKFFYKFYDIEIQSLPRVTQQSLRKPQPIYYKDLPDKEVIREAFKISSPLMKAIILFSCSSGCARAEALSLTIQDYIDAVSEYIPRRRMDIFEVIDFLNEKDDVVPTFNLRRKKTNKYYITYCSPEAVNAINAYILTRTDSVKNDSPLFDVSPTHLGRSFQKINDTLNLGNVGKYARFRSHMLRKFHASALYNDGMSIDKVNDLQGKAKNVTDSVYFMTNPEELKYEYIRHLPAVTINMDVEKLSIKSPEFMQLENDKKKLETELEVLKREVADIRSMKKDFELLKAQIGK